MNEKPTYEELEQRIKQFESTNHALTATMDYLEALVYVADMNTYEVIFINQYGIERFGDITGKVCWQALQKDQSGPCSFCTNKYLLDSKGNPCDVYVWEFQNTVNGHWYDVRDRAIRWIDDRIVRLEIATDITLKKEAEKELQSYRNNLEVLIKKRTAKLKEALAKEKILKGLIPICSSCKKIREDTGYWKQIEAYIEEYSEAEFSHGVCPECAKGLYPDIGVLNCWEFKKCGQEKNKHCPVVKYNKGQECWLVAGTMCAGEVQGTFARKIKSCVECDFYKYIGSPLNGDLPEK